jgi:hypothetical protein
MTPSTWAKLWFPLGLVGVAAGVNVARSGYYELGGHRIFAIGPGGTTSVFVLLACVFWIHCLLSRPIAIAAYCGASTAWLAMMCLTMNLASYPRYERLSSTLGIAAMLTPLFYLPVLLKGYVVGGVIGWIVKKICAGREIKRTV